MSYKQRVLLFFIVDSFIILLSVFLSYKLRFDFEIPEQYIQGLMIASVMIWITTYSLFYLSKLYRRIWQYASLGELLSIIRATTISILITLSIYMIYRYFDDTVVIPRSIFLISWMAIIIGTGGSRFIWRLYRDSYIKIQPHHKRALIIGAGNAGALVVRELKHSPDTDLYPVAFIDDDPNKQLLEVVGIPVVGTRKDIPTVVQNYNIDAIIIAIPSAPRDEIAEVIKLCKETGTQIKLLPRVSDLIHGKLTVKMIRDVNVEDLLGREPVEVDLEEISGYLKDRVVLVTGAGGSIGSELCRQISSFGPKKLLLLGHGENSIFEIENELRRGYPEVEIETIIADIQDNQRIDKIFSYYRPEVVFHAAAHKHVPLMERNPVEAIKNNIFGTRNVAINAHLYGSTRFVLISTDKAVNPTSVMGVTKRVAEVIIQSLAKESNTIFTAVRFGNVLGSRGSVIPFFKKQIEAGGPVTVTHPDMIRYFMTIPEAVQLVIQAGAMATGGEVFVLDMGKPVKIVDLAKDLIRLSGLEPGKDIEIQYTGIRPGEKLFEELLTNEEGMSATKHDRIFIGKPSAIPWSEVEEILVKLAKVHIDIENDHESIKILLKEIVPEYQIEYHKQYNETNLQIQI